MKKKVSTKKSNINVNPRVSDCYEETEGFTGQATSHRGVVIRKGKGGFEAPRFGLENYRSLGAIKSAIDKTMKEKEGETNRNAEGNQTRQESNQSIINQEKTPMMTFSQFLEEGVRPTPVDKPLDKAAYKKRRRSLAGKEERDAAKKRGHVGKEWYNSGRTYSPDEAKFGRANMPDHERSTRHRSAVDPDAEDDNYSADKTKNPKKLRKQKAMGEISKESFEPISELNRYEKETGKDFKTGKPSVKGGTAAGDKAYQHVVHNVLRKMQGRPQGQQKKVKGQKPPTAGQYGGPASPAQKLAMRKRAAQQARDNQSSRFD